MEGNVSSRLEGTDFKCRAQIPSMGHHTWLQISLLSLSLGLSSFCLRGDRASHALCDRTEKKQGLRQPPMLLLVLWSSDNVFRLISCI